MVKKIDRNNMKPFYLTALLFVFCSLFSSLTLATNITVKTSRNPAALNDSFHIIYETDSRVDANPDFSPINSNFDVLSSSQSTNMRSINGNWSMTSRWDLTVIAKAVGRFTIPPLNFGKDVSPAIIINVAQGNSQQSNTPNSSTGTIPAKIFLESTLDKKSGVVQSQFIYTIKLLRTVNLIGGSISTPKLNDADAIIEQISENEYETTRRGIRYQVYERRYAIFPQKSGVLKVSPTTFEGRINNTQPQSIFDQFMMSGQMKRLRSNTVKAKVLPAPKNINLRQWLPASKVQLLEEFSGDTNNIKAGEPITRTIKIIANNLSGVQIPDLNFGEIDGLKQYPDKAKVKNEKIRQGIVGSKQIKIALIPTHAGTFVLPEIKIHWWNTKSKTAETVSLKPVTLTVTGQVKNTTTPSTSANKKTTPVDNIKPETNAEKNSTTAQTTETNLSMTNYWMWLSLFFSCAWLITLFLLIKRTPPAQNKSDHQNKPFNNAKQAYKDVEKQIKNKQLKAVSKALISWAQAFYQAPHIQNLQQISDYCSEPLSAEIQLLNETLYSSKTRDYQGEKLLNLLQQEIKPTPKNTHISDLKPLYKK